MMHNRSYTYSLTIWFKWLLELRLEQSILITTKAAYYKNTMLMHFKIYIIQLLRREDDDDDDNDND